MLEKISLQQRLTIFIEANFKLLKVGVFFAVVLLYVVTAYYSMGMYYADEHFQIVEFANYILGNNSVDDMAWEFGAKIRPTFQPVICYLLIKIFHAVTINNPYNIAFGLRLITGVISIISLLFFIKKTEKNFPRKTERLLYYLVTGFLGFLAFLNVRFSSETFSGMMLLWGAYLLFDHKIRSNYLIGVVFGVAFLFRFQTLFSFIGVLFWLLFIVKMPWIGLFKIIIGFSLVLFLGMLVDSWFYNEFVFVPYNYFYSNIIAGAASEFGVSPWYYYVKMILLKPIFFIGVPMSIAIFVFFYKAPRNVLTWIMVPFFLAHSFVGHKELRFLFPLANFVPFIILFSYRKYIVLLKEKLVLRYLILIIVFVNFAILLMYSSKPAGAGRLIPAEYLYDNYKTDSLLLIHEREDYSFVREDSEFSMKFYKQDNLETLSLPSLENLSEVINTSNKLKFLLISKGNLERYSNAIQREDWTLVVESMPLKIKHLNEIERLGVRIPHSQDFLLLFEYNK